MENKPLDIKRQQVSHQQAGAHYCLLSDYCHSLVSTQYFFDNKETKSGN